MKKRKGTPASTINSTSLVRRIRDAQRKQFAKMTDEELIAHLNAVGKKALAEARNETRNETPKRRNRAG